MKQLFNVELRNYYHTFIEFRSSKSNNTKFLNIFRYMLLAVL
ncbi:MULTISPECIES: RteC domain-containing protein [Aquimarina]|uniref:Uncharacterized protein n=1 Tax=Aquimarina algiphila TaxID=2047982 RepID=A0A554VIC3_9FLAO|nr:hypothetical protein FOF46_16285 [Aquimarina algiphila]